MTQMFVSPSLASPMLDFTIKSNETISWISFHRPCVKIVTKKIAHFSANSCEITQIILIFLSQINIAN